MSSKMTQIIGHVMEYIVGGSLFDVIHNPDVNYTESDALGWVVQIVSGLAFLHKNNVIHGNIEPKKL